MFFIMKLFSLFTKYFLLILFSNIIIYPQHLEQGLENYIHEYYKNKNVPSISAGISIRDKIYWDDAVGLSDIENHISANRKTLYRIASISKVITAVAIMQLVEKNKIKLDDDARKYIPYFPKKKWRFTIRQILQHTAGLRTYTPGEFDSKEYFKSTKESVMYIANDSLVYRPGTKFLYTTLGYNLLAAIIEKVSGLSFPEYITKFIFLPCKMYSSQVEYQPQIVYNRARGYERNVFRELMNAPLADLSLKYAGGGFISNTEDLLKFAEGLLNNKLISRSFLDTMLVPTKLKEGQLDSGLGFEVNWDANGRFYFGHLGGGTGFVSLLVIYPEYNLAAVDLINLNDRDLGKPALDLANIALNNQFIHPRKSLADRMLEVTISVNIDSAFKVFRKIKSDSSSYYNLGKGEFNYLGYDLIGLNRYSDAIKVFNFLANEDPKDKSGYIGLGNAYYFAGQKQYSLYNYYKALKLDSGNKYIIDMIEKIKNH